MTFLEKARKENKHLSKKHLPDDCPEDYGLEAKTECINDCQQCWNREMPNTEAKEDFPFNEFEYNKGLNDAWELANKIHTMSDKEFDDAFGYVHKEDVFCYLNYDEALAKLKVYEGSQEIKEGDIVDICGNRAVVTSFGTDNMIIHVVYDDGITNSYRKDRKDIKKTGKHIDISSILEQIGE